MSRVKVRPLPVPDEYRWTYHANSNYGDDRCLRQYSGYPRPIKAVIPHGVFYEPWIYPGEAEAGRPGWPLYYVLNWPECRDEAWSEFKAVVPDAAPYLYALAQYPHNPERRGTILMPQHNTDAFDMHADWWKLNEIAHALPKHMKPVTVIMSWHDLDWQDRFSYPNKVRCIGHVNDQKFLEKLVWALTGAKYVISNDIGSYTYYALKSGCAFSLIDEPPVYELKDEKRLFDIWGDAADSIASLFHGSEDRHPEEQRRLSEVRALFPAGELFETPTQEHLDCADYYLRADAFKTPEEALACYTSLETPPASRG